MLDDIWQDVLTEEDKKVIDEAGYRSRGASTFASRGAMTSPALIIIDMQVLFVGDDVPIDDAIATAPTMIGERGWRAIDNMLPLISLCRSIGLPIFFAKMIPYNRPKNDPMLNFVAPLQPQVSDIIIEKKTSSIFFDTDLASRLQNQNIDSVILVGNSTSGCIRAAAVDAVQHGFHAIVPHDSVFDRIEASHKISLLDMWMKYATVTSSSKLISQLEAIVMTGHLS